MAESEGLARTILQVFVAICCFIAAPDLSSQEDSPGGFGETLDVVVVEVQAVVTDSDGRRVAGLGREDFRLLVDGRETAIEYFSEVREGRELPAPDGGTPTEEPAEIPEPSTDAAATAPGDRVATSYLVFVDDFFAIRRHRNVVLRGLEERLPELPAEDRMAVVAFDGEEIDVLTPWTSSREEAARGLERASKRPAHGLLRAHERLRRGEEGPWTDPVVQEDELRRVLTSVRSTLRMMPRPEGRKVLLLLGGGWPVRTPVPTTEEPEGSPFGGLPTTSTWEGRFDDRRLVHDLADAANLLGYTLYPVDVQGLRPGQSQVAQEGVATDPETGQAEAGTSPFTGEIFRQGTLRFLAHRTGGRALLYDERVRALEAVVADTRTYYSLGFTPRLQGDGSRHAVRLEVRRPGLEVRARTGFRDVSRTEDLDLLAESALRFGGAEGADGEASGAVPEEGNLAVSVGDGHRSGRRTMEMPLRVDVPWGDVVLLPGPGGLVAHLEIRVAVRDRQGSVSEMARIPVRLRRESRPDPGTVLRWETELTIRRERHDLVVTLYDAHSGRVMTRVVSVEP